MKFAVWVLDLVLAAGIFKLAHSAGVAPPPDLRTLLSYARGWL